MASMVDSLLVLDIAFALSNVPVLASAFHGRAGGGGGYTGWAGDGRFRRYSPLFGMIGKFTSPTSS